MRKKVSNTSVRNYLVYNTRKLPKNLLMLNSDDTREEDFTLLLFEGLVSTDLKGEITPSIADSWTITEDKLTYTFHIRENAAWSDGSAILAKDFTDFFARILREENNIYSNQLECIFGVKDYIDKKIEFNGVAITAKDDRSLEIRLNYPSNYFLDIISQPVFSLKKNFYNVKNWKTEYKKITYTGPFIIEDMYGNGEISLKRNENYWDSSNVLSNKLHVTNEESTAFALAKYKSGEIDAFRELPTSEINNFSLNEKLSNGPTAKGVSLIFNLNKNYIIKDINFRKVVSGSIDRNRIEEELNGVLEASTLYVPNNIKGASKTRSILETEILKEEMKKQLSNIYNGEVINIVYLNTEDNNKKIVDCIVKDLKSINLNVKSKGYDKEDLSNIIDYGDYEILLADYMGGYDSPLSFLEQWMSDSKKNIYGYNNSKFDEQVLRGKILSDNSKAEESFKQAEEIFQEDRVLIPIGIYNTTVYIKPYIMGIEVNKRGNVILKKMNNSVKNDTP